MLDGRVVSFSIHPAHINTTFFSPCLFAMVLVQLLQCLILLEIVYYFFGLRNTAEQQNPTEAVGWTFSSTWVVFGRMQSKGREYKQELTLLLALGLRNSSQ